MAAEIKITLQGGGGGGGGSGGGGAPRLTPEERADRDEERRRTKEFAAIERSERQARARFAREERAAERRLPLAEPMPRARPARGGPQTPRGGGRGAGAGAAAGRFGPPGLLGKQFLANAIGTAVSGVGAGAAGLAQNNLNPGLQAGVRAATLGLSALGPYGFAAAAGLQAAVGAVTAFKETVDAFVKRGRELAPFSGQLAGASANADVRKLQSDIREAQQVGPAMAKLIEVQSKTEATIQRILEPIKVVVVEKLVDFMEANLKFMVTILEFMEAVKPVLRVVGGLGGMAVAAVDIKTMIADIRKILAGGLGGGLIDDWLKALNGFGGGPPAVPGPARLGLPVGVPGP